MITEYRLRRGAFITIISMAVLCLFFINTLCWACPGSNIPAYKNTLAAQSVFKPLMDSGIDDLAEITFEILAGIKLLHAGKTPTAVNGILIETASLANDKRNIDFLPDIKRNNGQTIARFRIAGREKLIFEIKYQDSKIEISDVTNGNIGGTLSQADLAELKRVIDKRFITIAIDGESGSGKTSLASALAEKLGIGFFPYGRVFRLATLQIRKSGLGALVKESIPGEEIRQLADVLKKIRPEKFEYLKEDGGERYYYDGKDITDELDDPAVANGAPFVAQTPGLRSIIVRHAKAIIESIKKEYKGVVLEGRVTGTELAPDAELKIFLKTNLAVRAERRAKELAPDRWREILEKTAQDLRVRDGIDEHRDVMPRVIAPDSYLIDSTLLRKEEVLNNALIKLLETLRRPLPEVRAGPAQDAATAIDLVGFISPAQPYLSITHALYTLSGSLKASFKDKVRVSIHDMYADHSISIDSIVDDIKRNRPKILGLSIVAGTLNSAKELFDKIRDGLPEDQRPLIVLGNSVPTYLPEILLKEYFPGAIILQGEGEEPILELVEYVKGHKRMEDVHNLVYLKDGGLVSNAKSEADLDKIASPDMGEILKLAKQGAQVYIESSRGCPWGKCLFCASRDLLGSRKKEKRWRPRNTEQVLNEIKFLVDNGVETFNFADEESIGPGRDGIKKAQDLARGIIDICKKSGRQISFTLACRADSIWEDDDKGGNADLRDERIETFRLLKEAGLRNVFVGVESGSQDQLDRYNKGLKVAESENAIKILRRLRIEFEIGFIMFDPEVTLKEVEKNLSFLERNDLLMNTSWFLNTLRLYAGTPFAAKYKHKPEFDVPPTPDHNTLNYSYSFKETSVQRIEKVSHYFFGEIHRLYYFLKYIKRSDIKQKEFAIFDRYRKELLRRDIQYFRKFLKIERDRGVPEEKKLNVLYEKANDMLPEQIKFAQDLIGELEAAAPAGDVITKEVIGLAGAFIEKMNKRKSDEKVVDTILRMDSDGADEIIKPKATTADTPDMNEAIFIIKPGGTFNRVLIRDVLERIRGSGYAVSGVKVFSGEEIRRENIFERVYEFSFSVARKGEELFTKDDRDRMKRIYDKPEARDHFGISVEEAKIIPAYDLIEKYGLSEGEVTDLWTSAYKEEIFMSGDYRGVNKIGPCKYVLMTRHPRVDDGRPFLLVNGLLIQMKSLSEAAGEKTIVFLLRGVKGECDTWKDMREKIMGDRSPLHSPAGSIRHEAYKGNLAVTDKVPFWKNITHMSSGPLEALREEMLWFSVPLDQTFFARLLLASGYKNEEIEYLIDNPDVRIAGVKKPVFDWIEKMDSYEALQFILKVFPPFYKKAAMPSMTFGEYRRCIALHEKGAIGIAANKVDAKRITSTTTGVTACPAIDTPESDGYAAIGNSLIRARKFAQVLMSGGTAGRFFGYRAPEHMRIKFLADAYEFAGGMRSFAELKIANNLWAAKQAGGKIPIWVMTSALNGSTVIDFLKEHHYFGFPESDMRFYAEGDIPRVNPTREDLKAAFPGKPDEWIDARIAENGGEEGAFRYADGSISNKPVGHLDSITSLFLSQELLTMLDKGIEYISFSDAANLGTNIDPAILGMLASSGKDVLHVLTYKNSIFTIQIDGSDDKYTVILRGGEIVYSSLPDHLIPTVTAGRITRILDKGTGSEVKSKILAKLEKVGTLVDVDDKPQIVEGFRFPDNYDQGAMPYCSAVHQIVKVDAILRLFGMDATTYRKASREQLLESLSKFNARLNTYLEVKEIIDNDLGRNRIAAQFTRLSGDLTSLLPTKYVLVGRDGKGAQCFFLPAKEKEDIDINRAAVLNALTGRLVLQERPDINAREKIKLLEDENRDEKILLSRLSKFLAGRPVNMSIDLTAIPMAGLTEKERIRQLEENMETLARLIAWHNKFGLNVRYALEDEADNAIKDRAQDMLKNKLMKIGSIPGIDLNELLLSIGPPHAGNDVIEISLNSLEAIKAMKSIPDKRYCIALKDDERISGIAMPNYPAAANMGLSLAVLRIAKGKDGYDELRGKILGIFENIYKRYGILKHEDKFTADELELMVSGSSDTRLYYTIIYALPPIMKATIEELRKYHNALHILLQSA